MVLPVSLSLAMVTGLTQPADMAIAAADASVSTQASSATLAVIGRVPITDARKVGITSDDTVFVTSYTDGTVSAIARGSTTVSATIPTGTNAQGIAVGGDDSVYVTNTFAGSVSVVDPVSESVTRSINGFSSPLGIALSADDTVFVISSGSNTVDRVPPGGSSIDDSVAAGTDPRFGIAITSDDSVYVSDVSGDTIRIVDGRTMTVNSVITGVDYADSASTAGTASDDTVYFGQTWQPAILAISPGTDDTLTLPAVDSFNRSVEVVGPLLYAASDDSLVIYEREPWAMKTTVRICDAVNGLAINSSGVAYVACPVSDEVVVAAEVTAALGAASGVAGTTGSITLTTPDGLISDDSTIQSIRFGGNPATGWTRSSNTWSGIIPGGSGTVPVTVELNGGRTASLGSFTYTSPTPGTCFAPIAPMDVSGVFQINLAAHVEWIRDDTARWDDSYVMTSDIDLASCPWTSGIGDDTDSFTGIFDGDGYSITNIDVDISVGTVNSVSAGLFGQVGAGHIIRDLHVTGDVVATSPSAPTEARAGGVVGYAEGGVIDGVTFEGNVIAQQVNPHATRVTAGGLVGILWDDTIIRSAVHMSTVVAEDGDPYAGGLVGLAQGGAAVGTQTWIHDSYVWSSGVTARDQVSSFGSIAGGLIGAMSDGSGDVEVTDSFARGTVTVRDALAVGIRGSAGGIVGYANQGSINNTYAYVDVRSVNPQGTDNLGRIAGYVSSAPTGANNFWNAEIGGPTGALGFDGGSSLTGTGVTEAAMETMSTFSNAGWAIVNTYEPPGPNTWGICEGQSYPYLLWQAQTLTTPGNPCSSTPTIAGSAVVGQTLVASFTTPLTSAVPRWWHIDADGNEIPLIDYDETYVVSATDIGMRLLAEGTAFENAIVTRVFSSPTSVVADPAPPGPVPASAPQHVSAIAQNRSALVTWQPPATSGSFSVTNYEVVFASGERACLVVSMSDDTQSCSVGDLTNGQPYAFRVRALTGAGWGAFSDLTEPVTPRAQPILITGSREGNRIRVVGSAPDLSGAQVRPWIRFPGQASYSAGTGVRTVAEDGRFTWQRKTRKKAYVYFRGPDDVRSNRVIIPAR